MSTTVGRDGDAAATGPDGDTPGPDADGTAPGPDADPAAGPDADAAASELDRELRLARATELARAGHRDAADRLLAGVADPTAPELDLRARVHAQRGDLAAADELWARAAGAAGDPEAFAAQRAAVAAHRSRRIGTSRIPRWLGRALPALVLIALVVWAVLWGLGRSGATDGELAGLRDRQDRILARLDQVAARPQPAPSLPPDAGARLAVPGLDVLRAGDRITVRFRDPAFAGDSAEPTPQARDRLAELGRRLAALGPDVRVQVVGHTAPNTDPALVDGGDLGLARAGAAATALSAGGPARDTLTILSAGSVDPPFPGGAAGDAARDRTVTIDVTPAG